jgi:hypothetical protein
MHKFRDQLPAFRARGKVSIGDGKDVEFIIVADSLFSSDDLRTGDAPKGPFPLTASSALTNETDIAD